MDRRTDKQHDPFDNFAERSQRERRKAYRSEPKSAKDVMALVMNRRGYGRKLSMQKYQCALQESVGEALSKYLRVVGLRRGRLEIVVANSAVMQELTFHHDNLIKELSAAAPDITIRDLRFRIGPIENA